MVSDRFVLSLSRSLSCCRYLIPNSTAADGGAAPAEEYIAVVLETLISINGTKAQPVKDITISGITFRDAADITMNRWGTLPFPCRQVVSWTLVLA